MRSLLTLILGMYAALPVIASAQPRIVYAPGAYYPPQTYHSPGGRVPGGPFYYESGGALLGGVGATAASGGNPYAGFGGAFAGGSVGHQFYYSARQPRTYYYYPRPYRIQGSTAYMVRPGH